MRQIGRLVAFCDLADKSFVFELCGRCSDRLERLPWPAQQRQLDVATSQLSKHPERFNLRAFPDQAAAQLFVYLEAERLRKL